jgi:AcrR family transcriptional regulator
MDEERGHDRPDIAPGTRAYRSPLRERKAAETRARILTSAAETYAERGYTATVRQIAQRAGVSAESVNVIGSKPALLLEAFRFVLAGTGGWSSITENPRILELMSMPDTNDAVRGYVEFMAAANLRAHGIWATVRTAAVTEPTVAAALQQLLDGKRGDFEIAAMWWQSRGLVPAGASLTSIAGSLYVMTSQETFDQLVHDWGWGLDAYRGWLFDALIGVGGLLAPPSTG